MSKMGRLIKPVTLYYFIISCFLIGYAVCDDSLREAVKSGNVEEVRRLIDQGKDVNQKDENKNTLLCISVIKAGGAMDGYTDREKDFLKTAELLLSNGAEVNEGCLLGRTPLYCAVTYLGGKTEFAELLILRGADLDAKDDIRGRTPLHRAAYSGHLELAKLLISKGANVNAITKRGATPLDIAKFWKKKEMAELLIKHGGEYNFSGGESDSL